LPAALNVSFTHATLGEHDFSAIATNYNTYYKVKMPSEIIIPSKWFVEIYPSDLAWKVQGNLNLPLNEALILGLN